MPATVTWTAYAKTSYYEEIDFIDKKWTTKEVQDTNWRASVTRD